MGRPRSWVVAASAVGLATVPAPAAGLAAASGANAYAELAGRQLRPAPLVPTYLPSAIGPLGNAMQGYTASGSTYSIRLVHSGASGSDAIVVLDRGRPLGYAGRRYRSMRATLALYRKNAYRVRPARVRGRAGYRLTRTLGGVGSAFLVWREDGRIYSIGTGTTRKVSLAQLRRTAAGLDALERDYIGAPEDPDDASSGFAVTTERTISLDVEWQARCVTPGSTETTPRVGGATVTLLPRAGDAFRFDIAPHLTRPGPWTGTVSGTIAPDQVVVEIAASGVFGASTCDTGPLTFALDQRVNR